MVELCKGWNSRLGFSLKQDCQFTYISAIYPDSVASKDGRLQVGDRVIKVFFILLFIKYHIQFF